VHDLGLSTDGEPLSRSYTGVKGFLLDENLPSRLTFAPSKPVIHAVSLGANPSDSELWQFAQERQLVIVTKDADFSHRILVTSPPPWIVHLRFGNMRRDDYHLFLAATWSRIEALLPAHKLVCVYADRIEAFA
jgi:predicted nuclease of predicted toxin-antitoxin system